MKPQKTILGFYPQLYVTINWRSSFTVILDVDVYSATSYLQIIPTSHKTHVYIIEKMVI